MPVKTALRFLAGVLVLILSVLPSACRTVSEVPIAVQYPPAPDLPFIHMDGTTTTLADYTGESVLVVNFWGLRCQNCIEEMPFLERLHHKYGSRGLVILGINTDGVPADLLRKFLPQLPVTLSYPLVVDPDFALADGYKMMAAPLTVLIAKDGTVRFRHEGYEPSIEAQYVEIIEKLLAE